MTFLNKIFGIKDKQTLMDNAPYLAPWYFQTDNPKLFKDNKQLRWKYINKVGKEEVGVNILEDKSGNCYAIVDIYSYLLPSSDNKSFLIWCRTLEKVFGLQSIDIFYYDTDNLKPFADRDKAILHLKEQKQPFAFSINSTTKIQVDFDPTKEAMKFNFPDEFKKFGEFIFITELTNLYDNPNPENYWHNTTMLDFKTAKGWVFNYPQDWFNKSDCDFGYQWVTRAIRNPKTNLIHGQGIRLSDFVLDETNRNRNDKQLE